MSSNPNVDPVIIDSVKYYPKKDKSPLKSIRLFCLECMGWDRKEKEGSKPFDDVRECTDELCPLYEFRMGKNPYQRGRKGGNLKALEKYRKDKKKKEETKPESTKPKKKAKSTKKKKGSK